MKTLLYTLAMVTLLALPILAEEAKPAPAQPTVDFSGRMAAGFTSTEGAGSAFIAPDVKLKAAVNVDEDVKAIIRMNLDNGDANGADMAYIKADNLLKKVGSPDAFNPEFVIGKFKINFGEEALWNDPVNGALLSNSVANVNGYDVGLQLKQDLKIEMPVLIGISLAFLNGNGNNETSASKGYALKINGQMKENLPLSFSLSMYNSGKTDATVMEVMNSNDLPGAAVWKRNLLELDVRYDLDAKNFDPSKAPLFADAKGVFRLAFGKGSDKAEVGTAELNYTYIMLDGIYNINEKWYAAFRYSSWQDDDNTDNKFDRISIGGGVKLGENTALKATYDINGEPDVAGEDIANNTVSLMMTTKW